MPKSSRANAQLRHGAPVAGPMAFQERGFGDLQDQPVLSNRTIGDRLDQPRCRAAGELRGRDVDGQHKVVGKRQEAPRLRRDARSSGFQWFFSFYLVFLVESGEGHKDAMLLLDEPGLHLHPTGQQELIAFFETLSEKSQIIYTTHSPFLIDAEHIYRARPVVEDETGHSRITADTWPKDRETIFPLQAAAGYAMVRGLFQHKKNVLVEGMKRLLLPACSLAEMPGVQPRDSARRHLLDTLRRDQERRLHRLTVSQSRGEAAGAPGWRRCR